MRKRKLVQILESVPKKVDTKIVSTENKNPKIFFVKYPNGLVDLLGNKGKWQEVKKDDWIVTMPCVICEKELLLRVDDPVCTRCRSC